MWFKGIKRNTTDALFSDIVRERAEWQCENCRGNFENRRHLLDCSHFITRGNKRTRWDFENVSSICRGCHEHFTKNPLVHYEFMKHKLGEKKLDLLRMRSDRKLSDAKIDEGMLRLAFKETLKAMRRGILGSR